MSLGNKKISCVVCHAYLFPEDDVVYCPVCGAPHHRDCYNSLGHCGLEEFHGTEEQYDLRTESEEIATDKPHTTVYKVPDETPPYTESEGVTTCPICNKKYDSTLNSCPKCKSPNFEKSGGNFVKFDFLGGVPADYDIGEGVTADEAKRFVAVNSQRYVPKFAVLNKDNRISWNWAAFLFPGGWMLSRKMFANGIIASVLSIISSLLYFPFFIATQNIDISGGTQNFIKNFYEAMPNLGDSIIFSALISLALNLLIRLVSGLFGDSMYKKYTIKSVKAIKEESDDLDFSYRKKGGVNILYFLIGWFAVQNLPNIIFMFLK